MKARLQDDLKNAMRARDQLLIDTLRGLLAEIKKAEIDSGKALTGEHCVAFVQKEIKKRRDTIEFAVKGNRQDLVDQNQIELKILQRYLGEQLSGEELEGVVSKLIASGATTVGAVMGVLNKEYKGKFEGKVASEIAKKLFESR